MPTLASVSREIWFPRYSWFVVFQSRLMAVRTTIFQFTRSCSISLSHMGLDRTRSPMTHCRQQTENWEGTQTAQIHNFWLISSYNICHTTNIVWLFKLIISCLSLTISFFLPVNLSLHGISIPPASLQCRLEPITKPSLVPPCCKKRALHWDISLGMCPTVAGSSSRLTWAATAKVSWAFPVQNIGEIYNHERMITTNIDSFIKVMLT